MVYSISFPAITEFQDLDLLPFSQGILDLLQDKVAGLTSRSKDMLRQAYRLIQCGQNVNPQVLKERIHALGIPIDDKQTLELFDLLDSDGSGDVDGWEFVVGTMPKDYTDTLWQNTSQDDADVKTQERHELFHRLQEKVCVQDEHPKSIAAHKFRMSDDHIDEWLMMKVIACTPKPEDQFRKAFEVFGKQKVFTPRTLDDSFKRLGLVLHEDQLLRFFNKMDKEKKGTILMSHMYHYLVNSFDGSWTNTNQLWAGSDDHEACKDTENAKMKSKKAIVNHHPAQFPMKNIEEKIKEIMVKLDQKFISGGLSTALREKFSHFDKDRRGKISTRAFVTGVRSLCIAVTPEEVEQIYGIIDRDQDGYLSHSEFRRAFEPPADGEDFSKSRKVTTLPGTVVDIINDSRNQHIIPPRASKMICDKDLEIEAMQEPTKSVRQLRKEIEDREETVNALHRDGAIKEERGHTPKPTSLAGGLRREPKGAFNSLDWKQEYIYGPGDEREPELKAAKAAAYKKKVGKDDLMDDWPATLVAGGWRWSRAELVSRIQEKALSKSSSQAGSGLAEAFKLFTGKTGGGNVIDKTSFKDSCHMMNIHISSKGVDLFFEQYDQNNDGLLDINDLSAALDPPSGIYSAPRFMTLKQGPPKTAKAPTSSKNASRPTTSKSGPRATPPARIVQRRESEAKKGKSSPVPYWATDHPMRTVAQPVEWRDRTYEKGGLAGVTDDGRLSVTPKKSTPSPRKPSLTPRDQAIMRADSALVSTQKVTGKVYDLRPGSTAPRAPPKTPQTARPSTAVALTTAERALQRAGSVMSRPGTASSVKTVHRGGSMTERAPRAPASPKSSKAWSSPTRKMIPQNEMYKDSYGTPILQRTEKAKKKATQQW